MCGITDIIDLNGIKKFPSEKIMTMAGPIEHRGPDEFGILNQPGIALASRRLSIVDLESGKQPIYNEDQSIADLYNGELSDYIEKNRFPHQ